MFVNSLKPCVVLFLPYMHIHIWQEGRETAANINRSICHYNTDHPPHLITLPLTSTTTDLVLVLFVTNLSTFDGLLNALLLSAQSSPLPSCLGGCGDTVIKEGKNNMVGS